MKPKKESAKHLMCSLNWLKSAKVFIVRILSSMKLNRVVLVFVENLSTRREKVLNGLFFQSVYDIPIYNFAKISCENDYSFLYFNKKKRSYKIDKYIEQRHAQQLIIEFNNIASGRDLSIYEKNIENLQLLCKIRILEAVFSLYETGDVGDVAMAALRKYGMRGSVESVGSRLFLEYKKTCKKYIEKQKEFENMPVTNVNDFLEQLGIICSHYHLTYTMHTMSAALYAQYNNLLKKEIGKQKK